MGTLARAQVGIRVVEECEEDHREEGLVGWLVEGGGCDEKGKDSCPALARPAFPASSQATGTASTPPSTVLAPAPPSLDSPEPSLPSPRPPPRHGSNHPKEER